jgi:proteasome accessory factor B
MERMMRIHQSLQAGKFPNATILARELEVGTKTIHRDLEFMRDRLNLPLQFNHARNGYEYTEEVNAFPTLQLTEGELVALVVAEKALQQYRGTTFEKPLLSAIKKMEQSLPETVSVNLADVDQTISFRTRAEPILDLAIFDTLARAAARHQQLEITYRKAGERQGTRRQVDPYHLANINGEWFLFAHDHLRGEVRTFAPGRILEAKPTGRTFERSARFSLEQRLRDSFGVHAGQGEYKVILRFNAAAADYIREKKWHASQELKELKDGSVELRLKLSSLEEVARWVLNWAGNARVLHPPELVEKVRTAAKRLLQAH